MIMKYAINEFGIKYWTSNPVWVKFQEHGSFFYVNIEEKLQSPANKNLKKCIFHYKFLLCKPVY
jgi:hypothetical protein